MQSGAKKCTSTVALGMALAVMFSESGNTPT